MAEFTRFIEAMSSEATETKINELSEILNKVLQIITKALDDLTIKMVKLEERVNMLSQRIDNIQLRIQKINTNMPKPEDIQVMSTPEMNIQKDAREGAQATQKIESKAQRPVSTRAAVNVELKELFRKLKSKKSG
ncbi:MAG: hypothetical protein ACTSRP_00770 [Candidatus Helarchaeota archaeon]